MSKFIKQLTVCIIAILAAACNGNACFRQERHASEQQTKEAGG